MSIFDCKHKVLLEKEVENKIEFDPTIIQKKGKER